MAVYKPSLPEIPKLTRAEQHLVGQAVLGEWATFPIDGDEPEAERKTIRRKCSNASAPTRHRNGLCMHMASK